MRAPTEPSKSPPPAPVEPTAFSPSTEPSLTVLIPAFNGKGIVEGAIRSVLQQRGIPWDLVVVDDGSSDGTFESVWELVRGDSRVRVVRNNRNLGVARTLNRGIGMAKGSYLLILHQDCRLESNDWLARAVNVLESSSAVCLVGNPRHDIRSMRRSEKWSWIIREHTYPANSLGRRAARDSLFSENKCDVFQIAFLRSLGGFDERILGGGEDQVLAYRLARVGARVVRADDLQYTLTLGGDPSLRRNLRKDFQYGRQIKQVIHRTRLGALRRSAEGTLDRRLTNRLFGVAWILASIVLLLLSLFFPVISPLLALLPPSLRGLNLEVRAVRVRRTYELGWADLATIPFVGLIADLAYFAGLISPSPAATDARIESDPPSTLQH